jgi:hypothetical protein
MENSQIDDWERWADLNPPREDEYPYDELTPELISLFDSEPAEESTVERYRRESWLASVYSGEGKRI